MSFDPLARSYLFLETIAFGTALQRARTAFLREVSNAQRVLIVGEGNGRFLLELLQQSARAQVDCVDASEAMLELARQRVERRLPASAPRVRFIHTAIEDCSLPDRHYDLIVTHFVLDCFPMPQLETIVAKLAQAAAPEAVWLLADFCYPFSRGGRLRAEIWIKAMYLFFRAFAGVEAHALVDPSAFLGSHDFNCVQRKIFQGGLVKSEVWKRVACAPQNLSSRAKSLD